MKENLINNTKEIYIRDAQGNVLAVYEVSKKNNVDSLFSREFYIYGSSRLGYLMDKKYLSRKTYGKTFGGSVGIPSVPHISIPNPFILPGTTTVTPLYFGNKRYELTDWLGNVRVVINDKKTPVNTGTTTVSYFPQVINVRDYYSFGSQISERSYDPVKPMYRFGFNGKDQQNELYGVGDAYDFGARIYNALIGKFMSIDPDFKKYPQFSPYSFSINNPIRYVDIMGLGPGDRIKAARQFIEKGFIKYSIGPDNWGRKNRTEFTQEALKTQDCVELVTRVLLADKVIVSMNVGDYGYYLANKNSIGVLLFNKDKFIQDNKPQVGDIAFWEGHVGIVSDVDPKTGKFKLIHAANTRSGVLENLHYASPEQYRSSQFYGFFRPKAETPDGKNIDITQPPAEGQPNVNLDQSPYKQKSNGTKAQINK